MWRLWAPRWLGQPGSSDLSQLCRLWASVLTSLGKNCGFYYLLGMCTPTVHSRTEEVTIGLRGGWEKGEQYKSLSM